MYPDSTIQLISLALDASLMRQTAIANNIANNNTVSYQAMNVNFEQQLTNHSLTGIKPFFELSNNSSSIDEQIALGVKNSTQYRALIKGVNYKISLMKLALHGNN
jgi:flagellar basal-body rod protein FlgB